MANKLNKNDRTRLQQIAAGDSVHSQRATALLALDSAATLETAAKEAGLTVSAVRYWRSKFIEQGMAIFPEELPAELTETTVGKAEKKKKKGSKGGKKKSGKKGKKKDKKKDKKKSK